MHYCEGLGACDGRGSMCAHRLGGRADWTMNGRLDDSGVSGCRRLSPADRRLNAWPTSNRYRLVSLLFTTLLSALAAALGLTHPTVAPRRDWPFLAADSTPDSCEACFASSYGEYVRGARGRFLSFSTALL